MSRDGRFDVFLSYARSDGAAAAELNSWLRARGFRTFFDRSDLRPGLRWVPALEDAIDRSDAVGILLGRHGMGNTQQYERELALVRQTRDNKFPVIPVLLPGCENPPTGFLQLLTWIDLSRDGSALGQTDSLEALCGAIRRQPVPPSAVRIQICPYRGLEPFREEDAALYCGRDDAIRDLVSKVQTHSFVAVVGSSGSGKSSLVFAGLLPALRQQRQTKVWDVVWFRPGASPLRALADAFGTAPQDAGPASKDTYLENEAAAYREGDLGKLRRVINDRLDAAPEKPDRVLIYVDQWEELYAMAPTIDDAEQRRQHFSDVEKMITLLVATSSGEKSRASVVLTVRADFYNFLIRNTLLSGILPRQQVNIPPMGRNDLRSAIETPAQKTGLSFVPPALVDQILDDVGTEDGRLPLLQFALKETWERRDGDRLSAAAYTEVGGVTGAIQKTAEGAYAALTPAQQSAARRLFLRLVTPGEGREDVRARSTIPEDPQQRDIVDLFSNPRTRLLVTGYDTPQGPAPQEGRDPRATVEVAHEALIRRWPTLRAWVDESREKLRARAAILRAKAEWEEKGGIDKFLLDPGIQLERGRSLLDSPGDVPVDDIREYVDRSIQKEKRRLNAERESALAAQKRITAAERQAKEAAEDAARQSEAARAAERQAKEASENVARLSEAARAAADVARRRRHQRRRTFITVLVVLGSVATFFSWQFYVLPQRSESWIQAAAYGEAQRQNLALLALFQPWLPPYDFSATKGLANISYPELKLNAPNFSGVRITAVNFSNAQLPSASFARSSIRWSNFRDAKLKFAQYGGAEIRETIFANADLYRAVFARAVLCDVDFSNADLQDASFWGATLDDRTYSSLRKTAWWIATGWNSGDFKKLVSPQNESESDLKNQSVGYSPAITAEAQVARQALRKSEHFREEFERPLAEAGPDTLARALALNDMAWTLSRWGIHGDRLQETSVPCDTKADAKDPLDAASEAICIIEDLKRKESKDKDYDSLISNFRDTQAYILMQMDRMPEAKVLYEKDMKGTEGDPGRLFRYAITLSAVGSEGEATKRFEEAIKAKKYLPKDELVNIKKRYIPDHVTRMAYDAIDEAYPVPKPVKSCAAEAHPD